MRIFETVGAIDVECFDGCVVVTQYDPAGNDPSQVFIPYALVNMVCKAMRETSKEGVEI